MARNKRPCRRLENALSVWMSASGPLGGLQLSTRAHAHQRTSFEVDETSGLPSGDQSAVEPPGPIPNPEVKRRSADGSGTTGPVRVGRRQVYAPFIRKNERGFFLHPQPADARSYLPASDQSQERKYTAVESAGGALRKGAYSFL
jgi:hypothetical protein